MSLSQINLPASQIADGVARKIGAAAHGIAITVQSKAGDKCCR